MDEAGTGIITYSPTAKRKSRIAQRQGSDARDANIDGVSLHVQAVLRDTGGAGAEILIALGAAIAADDLNLSAWMTDGGGEIVENVEDAGIVMLYVAGSVIPKEMVQLYFCFRNINIAAPVNDVDAFAGVCMIEAKMVLWGGRIERGGRAAALRRSGQKHQGQEEKSHRG